MKRNSNYFESSTSCFNVELIVCSLVPNPIFIEVFIFIRMQGTDRTTVNSAKRHKSHMTCSPARYNESLLGREKDQARTSKLQNDRCFISIPAN